MLIWWKRDKVQASSNKDKECWHEAQRLWSIKHEKRDKQNITLSQSGKEEKVPDNLAGNSKTDSA